MGMGVLLMNRPVSAVTGINEHINFQGRLFNAQGATVPDGNYNIQFKIYQDGAGTAAGNPGGSLEWTEEWLNDDGNGVQIKNGYMSVELGSVNPFGSSIDWNQDTLWLSMNIGDTNTSCTPFSSCSGDGEMVPMKRLSSSVYALNAGKLGGLTSTQFLQLAQGVQTDASTNTTSIYLNKTGGGNFLQLQSSGTDVFTLSNSGDIQFGNNADHTISVGTSAASTAGRTLTVSAGTGGSGTGSAGGDLVLQGGDAGGTNGNGGNVTLNAGAKTGSGTDGTISIGTSNTSAITLGANVTLSGGKSLTITGGITGSRPASPTEGMVYYDTTTKQLLTYANGKWQGDRSTSTKIVAASNSSQAMKDAADYVTDGTADESEINSALTAAAGGQVYLAEGTYVAAATILIPNNTILAGAGRGTVIELGNLDSTENLIENSDTTTGTGVVIRDLKLDGRSDLNTAGTQYGIYLNGIGSGSGSSAIGGATISNISATRFRNDAVYLTASSNSKVTSSTFRANTGAGLSLNSSSSYNVINDNQSQGNSAEGFLINGSNHNTFSGNNSQGNSTYGFNFQGGSARNTVSGNSISENPSAGIRMSGETRSTVVGNTIRGGGSNVYGIYLLSSASNNAISSNNIYDTGGAGTTNGIYLDVASYNNLTNNVIGDSSCTTTCYAININNASATGNYVASNNIDSGASINNIGTNTLTGGQMNGSGAYNIQASGGINLQNNTSVTGSLTASTSVLAPTIDTASAGTLSIGTTNATAITLAKNTTVTANLTVSNAGNVAFQRGSDFSTTGSSDDVNFGTGVLFRLTGASAQTITGIANGVDGRVITLVNAASQAANINNEAAGSSASNRIITGTGSNISLPAGSSVSLVYDSGASRWRVVGAAGTSDSYIQLQGSTPGTAQTGNFNISGTGIAATLQGNTSVLTPLLDTASAGTLSIGTTNATAINLNQNTVVAAGKSLTITGGNTASRPGSPSEGMMYYDTTTKQLLTYANGKWQGDRSTASKIVAANNSSQAEKDAADYVADGTADESEINSALTAASGGNVYLFKGTYNLAAAISVPNNTSLAGAGAGTVLTIPNAQNGSYAMITNTDASTGTGVTVRDLAIDGNKANQSSGGMNGIFFDHMGGGSGSSARAGGELKNVLVKNMYGTGSGASGVGIRLSNSSNNTLIDNKLQANGYIGLYITSSSSHNSFTGNVMQGNTSYGVYLNSNNNTLSSNTVQGNTNAGIYVSGASNNTLSANTVSGNGANGIRVTGASASNTITGNTISSNTTEGIYLNSVNNNTITGNNLNANTTGVVLDTASYNTVSGNEFKANTTAGIQLILTSTYNTIDGNMIYDSGNTTVNNGIYISASDNNSITSNNIYDTTHSSSNYAIYVFDSTSDANYLADNSLGGGSINDNGTGTIMGGQLNSSGNFVVQPAGTIDLHANTTVTGSLTATTSVLAPTIDTASAGTLSIGTTNATAITLAKNTTVTANLTVTNAGNVAFERGTDFSTTGTSNDVSFGTGALFRLTGASAQTITGIAGGANGRIITLVNAASQAATIANNSGSSSAGNKIITGTGANITVVAGGSISLVYDSGDSVWRVVGAAGTSDSYIQLQASTPGTAQTGNFNISGTGIAATLQGSTSVLTPLLDTVSAGTLNIGTTNATGISLNQDVTIAANKSITYGAGTGSFDQSASSGTFKTGTGAVSLNGDTTVASGKNLTVTSGTTSLTGTTNINTTGGGATSIGNSSGGAVTIAANASSSFTTSTGTLSLQAASGIQLQSNTSVTGTLSATTSLQAPLLDTASAVALNIGTTNATSINLNKDTNLVGNLTFDSGANRTLSIGTSAASTAGRQLTIAAGTGGSGTGSAGGDLQLQGGAAGGTNANGGNIYLDAGAKAGSGVDGSIYLGSTRATTIQIGNTALASGTQTINIGTNNTSGGTTNITIGTGSTATGGTTALQAKSSITLTTNGTTRATFDNTNSVYFGNGVTAAAPNAFTISGTGSSTSGTAGGALTIQGGNATVGNANGGNVTLTGGSGFGTGVKGLVVIDTPTFTTASTQNCAGADCTITQANVNNSGAVVVTFSSTGFEAAIPDPTITTAGRIVYVTAANGSSDFTLCLNDVAAGGTYDGTCNTTTGNSIAMRANTTATLVWNGSDWTAAGASSSTDLQAAYNNTLTSAGAAELVVASSSNANGLTIRDSSTSPVNGTLLEVQNSAAATLFSVNGTVTEYASNAGAESTFSASNWVALGSSTVTRNTTASNVASGQGSAQVATTTAASDGVKNVLSTTLTASQHYNLSFSAKLSSGTFTDLAAYYSIDGSANSVTCTTGQAIKTKVWTKVTCAFTAPTSGITSNNSINIRQVGSGTARTFYVDNISVTIAADYNYATDGTVNDNTNFTTNWTAVGTSTISRNTSDGQEASDSAQAAAGTTAGNGVKNKLSINPLASTLYRVSVYAKLSSGSAFTDFTVRYTPDNGSTFVNCVDYNTQTVTTTDWTQITCYVDTASTTVTNPYVHFVQTAAAGVSRTFLVDDFSMTLSSAATPNVQIGGGTSGGPVTLFTLDRGASAPIAENNDALLGSMYYDTTLGKLQCYEADGWGACGSSPDNVITISPEYTNAVLHGTGIGTMTSDLCSDTLNINDGSSGQSTICGTNETYNFYKWTSPQSTAQTYSIYVTYQLPSTFKEFSSGSTSLMGRTDSSNSTVDYQVYRSNASGLTACGSTVSVSTGSQSSWQTGDASGSADPSTCSFAASESIVFKINVTASSNANAYVGNLNFTFSNR